MKELQLQEREVTIMERRKRKISVLCILSMLAVILLGVGAMDMKVQAEEVVYEEEVPPFQKYVLEEIGGGYYKLTINYKEGETGTAIEGCGCGSGGMCCYIKEHISQDYKLVKHPRKERLKQLAKASVTYMYMRRTDVQRKLQ